ncbi:unnamed protein product [Symbiodinium sp. CCMP2592]|nr:unnamed protein product [Symbiodinium sp. CCMP2592]
MAPLGQKMAAITSVAWPRALHAVSLVHLGNRHFQSLRAAAMKSLRLAGPGASPWLQFSLLQFPTADPGFAALQASVVDFCRFGQATDAVPCLDILASAGERRVPGPLGVLVARLHEVGVSWFVEGSAFRDSFGEWSPWTTPLSEIRLRLVSQWQTAVAVRMSHRPGFQGLAGADPALTRRVFLEFPAEQQPYLRVALNGTFYTQAELHHIGQEESSACVRCGQPDSILHRLLHCPFFASARAKYPPPAGSSHDLFTDGTCSMPACPELRLAAWSVILANAGSAASPVVLAAQPLPGLVQTSFRAELFAMLVALTFASRVSVPVRVWSDCGGVVSRTRSLLSGSPLVPGCSNHDLWQRIHVLCQTPGLSVTVLKVPSHEDATLHDDPVDQWAVEMNAVADRVADEANRVRDDSFVASWQQLRDWIEAETGRVRQVMKLHVEVALLATHTKAAKPERVAHVFTSPDVPPLSLDVSLLDGSKLYSKYGNGYVQSLLQWTRGLFGEASKPGARCRWIAVYQLFFSFVMQTRVVPPVYMTTSKAWSSNPHVQVALVRRVQGFGRQVRDLWQTAGAGWPSREGRPESALLLQRLCVLPLRVPDGFIEDIDRYFASHKAGQSRHWWRSLCLPSEA